MRNLSESDRAWILKMLAETDDEALLLRVYDLILQQGVFELNDSASEYDDSYLQWEMNRAEEDIAAGRGHSHAEIGAWIRSLY